MNKCPACDAEIKSGIWSSNNLLPEANVALLNLANDASFESYCSKCSEHKMIHANTVVKERMKALIEDIQTVMTYVPIVSLQNPQGWDYKPIAVVTAQSVTGTGIASELSATFNDLFGTESNTLNSKLKQGEDTCFARLRKRAIEVGGNAVLALDIDYAEVGSLKGMLMVCCTGTAVKVKNVDALGEKACAELSRINELTESLNDIQTIYNAYQSQIKAN